MKLKEEAEGAAREENGRRIKEGLEALPEVIEGLNSVHVFLGVHDRYDLCAISEFESQEAFDNYGPHPEHQRMRTFIHKVVEDSRPSFIGIF